jgi:Zn-dependent M28 family amino/carboxypeptidase
LTPRYTIALVLAIAGLEFGACSTSNGGEFSPVAVAAAQSSTAKIDSNALRPNVEGIVRVRGEETPIVSRINIKKPLTHVNSGTFVADAFRALGYTPTLESFGSPEFAGTNVFVDIVGSTPELVLVTGHHDSWFQSGADDNASALAVLIEAARALRDAKMRRTIRLVAFDREEEGIMGSSAYALAHERDVVRIILNMDCVGYASREKGSQDAPTGFALRDTGDFLAVLANEPAFGDASRFVRLGEKIPRPIEVLGLLAPDDVGYPGVGDFRRSDQAPYWARGIPALFITDTADFRNHNYHTEEDTPEKLDYQFLASVTQLVVGAATAFATDE